MNFILIIVYWAVGLIMAGTQYKVNFSIKNIVLENTLPSEAVSDPAVKKLLVSFLKRLLLSTVIFGLLLFSILFIPYDSIVMLLFFVCMFGNMSCQFVINIKAIEEMHELKLERGWVTENSKVIVDLKTMRLKNRRLFPVWWFIFPLVAFIVIVLIGLKMDNGSNSTVFSQIFMMNLLIFIPFMLIGLWIYYLVRKIPVHAVTRDSLVNQKVNDVQKSFYGRMILAMLVFAVIMSGITMWSALNNSVFLLIFLLALVILFIGYTFHLVFGYRRETNQLLASVQPLAYDNEDQYWRYGIYMNPDDHRLFVPSRNTMQLSFNLGRPAGKAILGVIGVLILGLMIGLSAFLGYNDFTPHPFQAEVIRSTRTLELKHAFVIKKISLNDIQSVELVGNEVKNADKISGTNTENYYTGTFSYKNQKMYLLIFRKTPEVVYIKAKSDNYYINERTVKDTRKMFENLKEEIQNGGH
ncbi:PH domain-containing protein [Lactovum odontotermitis]